MATETTIMPDSSVGSVAPKQAPRKTWSFTPELPVTQAAWFERPFSAAGSVKYLFEVWRPFSPRFLMLLVAIAAWIWFTPSLERAATFQPGWMLEILLRNLCIVLVVVGGLHLFLYTFRKQEDELRYDARPLATNSKIFHFGNQVWDNAFWTLAGSVPVGTLWECLLLWGYANGYAPLVTFTENPIWFVALMLAIPLWSGFHFYWFHRLLHVGPIYRRVHSWHHKNVNVGPWSGHAMHPAEHVGLYSDLVVYFLIASHPVHVIFNAMLHTIGGPTSHCGYHKVKFTRHIHLQLGDFMHQLHHRFVDCNYGTLEDPWDRIFGSFHDGTPEADAYIRERRIRMYANKKEKLARHGRNRTPAGE